MVIEPRRVEETIEKSELEGIGLKSLIFETSFVAVVTIIFGFACVLISFFSINGESIVNFIISCVTQYTFIEFVGFIGVILVVFGVLFNELRLRVK